MSDAISTTILVDVGNLAYRSFYAMPKLKYESFFTGLFHGFLKAVLSLQTLEPDNMIFCWDYGVPGQPREAQWRRAIYPAYKSKRVKSAESAIIEAQLPDLHQVLKILGYCSVGVPGLEADDIMGLLSFSPGKFFLFSTDDDLFQLLEGSRVQVLRRKQVWQFLTQASVEDSYGMPIHRWPVYLALGGDKSDCIRPLPRCGPAGALDLALNGADPNKPFKSQPVAAQVPRFAPQWDDGTVAAAYAVAHIPRSAKDWRIRDLVRKYPLPRNLQREINMLESRCDLFYQFCVKYGLTEHAIKRSQFFPSERLNENQSLSAAAVLSTAPSRYID